MGIFQLLARDIAVPRQRLDLAYAEWDLREDTDALGWDCIAQFIADLEAGREFFRLRAYPYSRGSYALRELPRDWDYYKNVCGRQLIVIQIKRDNPALLRLLQHYDRVADGVIADNHDRALFDHPIRLEPGFASAADETALVTGHDCDFVFLLSAEA
ncbi:MAG TPA: hypothetical protein VD886_17690 [Herpetosiphonaceae bacterium]|nr:hypothetical protein [Herpetosiphonaceae bacterium]